MPVHENLVVKGMHADGSPSMQPQHTYRYSNNGRIISNSDNTYSWENEKGDTSKFGVNVGYRVVGACDRIEGLVVFAVSSDVPSTSTTKVYTVDFDESYTATTTEIYSDNLGMRHVPIECWITKENDQVERVYWNDNINSPRALNILDPNVATIPVDLLDYTPIVDFGKISFWRNINSGGSYTCGMYQAAFRLSTDLGYQTGWSELSNHVPVGLDYSSNDVQGYIDHEGDDNASITNRALNWRIEDIDTDFDNIEIAIFKTSDDIVTDTGTIAIKETISGSTMFITTYGNENLGDVLADDVLIRNTEILQARTGIPVKNRSFLGSYRTTKDFDFNPSTVVITEAVYELPSDNNADPLATLPLAVRPETGHVRQPTGNVPSGTIVPRQWYQVSGGTITYNAVVYGDAAPGGEYFQGEDANVAGFDTYAVTTGSPVVFAVIRTKKFSNGGTDYYDHILIRDDYLDYKGMTAATHRRTMLSKETYRFGILIWSARMNPMLVKWIGDHEVSSQDTQPLIYQAGANLKYYGLNVKGVNINGIDMGQIALDLGISAADLPKYVGGFSIVMAPLDRQFKAQGMLWPVVKSNGFPIYGPVITPKLDDDKAYDAAAGNLQNEVFMFYSPEKQFEFPEGESIGTADKLRLDDVYRPYNLDGYTPGEQGNAGMNTVSRTITNSYFWQKYFEIPPSTLTIAKDTDYDIDKSTTIIGGQQISGWRDSDDFYNMEGNSNGPLRTIASMVDDFGNPISASEMESTAGKGEILELNSASVTANGDIYTAAAHGDASHRFIASIYTPKTNLYGGASPSAKANTEYIYAGHFQPINASVYADNGNTWVFNGVEVFGGNGYVNLYDFARITPKEENMPALPSGQPENFAHSMVFPVESLINTSLREGRTPLKNGTVDSDSNPEGIDSFMQTALENFVYNQAYSVEENQIFRFPRPLNFLNIDTFPSTVIYSPVKIAGEFIDNYRIFPANNFKDLRLEAGEVMRLMNKFDRLFYWQELVHGYIPVNERITTNGAIGAATTLGTSGVAERTDELNDFFGLQHQFAITEVEKGFYWFDGRKSDFLAMTLNGQTQEVAMIKGMDNWMENDVTVGMLGGKNHITGAGIFAVYNPRFKEAVFFFKETTTTGDTLSFNTKDAVFNSFHSYRPTQAIPFRKNFLLWGTDNVGWMHNTGNKGNFHNGNADSELWFVINPDRQITKVFGFAEMNVEDLTANGTFFKDLVIENTIDTASDLNIISSGNRNYKFRDRKWLFNYPTLNRKKLRGKYLLVKLTKDNSGNENINVVSLITNYRHSR